MHTLFPLTTGHTLQRATYECGVHLRGNSGADGGQGNFLGNPAGHAAYWNRFTQGHAGVFPDNTVDLQHFFLLQFLNETHCIEDKHLFINDDFWVFRVDLNNLEIMLHNNFFSPIKHRKLIYELMELYRWIVNHDEAAKLNNLALIIKGKNPVREMVLFYSEEVRKRISTVRKLIKHYFPDIAAEHEGIVKARPRSC